MIGAYLRKFLQNRRQIEFVSQRVMGCPYLQVVKEQSESEFVQEMAVGINVRVLVTHAKANEVWGNHPVTLFHQLFDHLSEHERPRRLSMQAEDGFPCIPGTCKTIPLNYN